MCALDDDGGQGQRTTSAPCLFFHGMHCGNLVARNTAMGIDVSTARWSGVFQLTLRLTASSS